MKQYITILVFLLFSISAFSQGNINAKKGAYVSQQPREKMRSVSNKALVIVNSKSADYPRFTDYIQPYLDNFGIPYEVWDVAEQQLVPDYANCAVVLFGHDNVGASALDYHFKALSDAVKAGTGLCSFDAHVFDYKECPFTEPKSFISDSVVSDRILIAQNTGHFITQYHIASDNSDLAMLDKGNTLKVRQNSRLKNGIVLVQSGNSNRTDDVALMEVSSFGTGKVVRWNGTGWMCDSILGQFAGIDDLVWRGIVWAARKPFVMQGIPPFITMRVDDADGNPLLDHNEFDPSSDPATTDFAWVGIANKYGIKPFVSTFYRNITSSGADSLSNYIRRGTATSSPHALNRDGRVYVWRDNFAASCNEAKKFYDDHGIKMSSYFVPHCYELDTAVLPYMKAMGCEFLVTHQNASDGYCYATSKWLKCGPYRLTKTQLNNSQKNVSVYYAGYSDLGTHNDSLKVFVLLSEVRNDNHPYLLGYDWLPLARNEAEQKETINRGVRQLKRELTSQTLSSLFTHEQLFDNLTKAQMDTIFKGVTDGLAQYNPIYTTMDYAAKYIRAKTDITISGISYSGSELNLLFSGTNDMPTKCYMFTDKNGKIASEFIDIPQMDGAGNVKVSLPVK